MIVRLLQFHPAGGLSPLGYITTLEHVPQVGSVLRRHAGEALRVQEVWHTPQEPAAVQLVVTPYGSQQRAAAVLADALRTHQRISTVLTGASEPTAALLDMVRALQQLRPELESARAAVVRGDSTGAHNALNRCAMQWRLFLRRWVEADAPVYVLTISARLASVMGILMLKREQDGAWSVLVDTGRNAPPVSTSAELH